MENYQNDNNKMYEAIRSLKKLTPKEPLLMTSDGEYTTHEQDQADIISKYFEGMFFKDAEPMPDVQPVPMREPFSAEEVMKSTSKLKTNKSPGCDDIPIELIKNSPREIFQHIDDIYNNLASSGDCPAEINHGILVPLQKPGKPRGPVSNLRPIILLSTLSKILAVIIMNRII